MAHSLLRQRKGDAATFLVDVELAHPVRVDTVNCHSGRNRQYELKHASSSTCYSEHFLI